MTLNSRDVRHKVRRPFSSVNLPTQRRISRRSPKSGIFAETVDLRWYDWSRELVVTGSSKMWRIENSWRDLERESLSKILSCVDADSHCRYRAARLLGTLVPTSTGQDAKTLFINDGSVV